MHGKKLGWQGETDCPLDTLCLVGEIEDERVCEMERDRRLDEKSDDKKIR